jgi:hypothetical protein
MTSTSRTSAPRGLPATAAVVVAVVALTGGMAWFGQRVSTPGPRVPQPGPGRHVDVDLAYVGLTPAGPRLFTETHQVPDTQQSDLTVAIGALMTERPRDDDYRNYLLSSTVRAAASEHDGTVTIDFSTAPRRAPGVTNAIARIVLQSMVRTADQAVGTAAPVRFTVGGEETEKVLGVATGRPLRPADPATIDSAVAVETPSDNSFVHSGSVVRGRALTPDGRVYWAVYRNAGLVLAGHGRSDAGPCCTFAPFTFRLPTLTRGSPYVLVVGSEPDLGDGGTTVDTKEFSIR